MDPQIEELKQLVRQNIALTQETNKMVHGMRNAGRLKSIFWLVVFLGSVAISIYSYFFFVAPRIQQITTFYQTNIAPLQGASDQFMKFFQGSSQGSTSSDTPAE